MICLLKVFPNRPLILHAQCYLIISWAKIYPIANSHPLIKRYMRGVFNSRSLSPRYSEIWDVQPVLSYLTLMHPLDKLTLKELSFKRECPL